MFPLMGLLFCLLQSAAGPSNSTENQGQKRKMEDSDSEPEPEDNVR